MASFWKKISPSYLGQSLKGLFKKSYKNHEDLWNELEEALIESDVGIHLVQRLMSSLKKRSWKQGITQETVEQALCEDIEGLLNPLIQPLNFQNPSCDKKPRIILMVGVNGSGKTTTIAKLAHAYKQYGHSIALVAGDTFRAAAVEQLCLWGDKLNIPVFKKAQGTDPSALVYESIQSAQKNQTDILIVDTAGRLHNNTNLMDELEKIIRVMRKIDPQAPHESLLILDGTVGQNALTQVNLFKDKAAVTGLIMTKMDGTARGGILMNLLDTYKIPIVAVTYGEDCTSFGPLDAKSFAHRWIAGDE
jgi:fused signal recognition particle receptor